MLAYRDLTNRIIGLAIEVHRTIGPGLLESVYAACLCDELAQAGVPFQQEVGVPVIYKGRTLHLGFRADILVADAILIEVKAVAALLPAHDAQVLTLPHAQILETIRRGHDGAGTLPAIGQASDFAFVSEVCASGRVLTYPRMSPFRIGLRMNFHATRLKDGLRRFIV